MKNTLLLLLFSLFATCLSAQPEFLAPDTLLRETFDQDPSANMLDMPSGFDDMWVNWDEDKRPTYLNALPQNWFWDADFDSLQNGSFRSSSYLGSQTARNRNWLVSPPVYVGGNDYWLSWRSCPFEGPGYMDGYKVLISTATNIKSDFKETLFLASETTRRPAVINSGSQLDLSKYSFSLGYQHAKMWTDTNYFELNVQYDPTKNRYDSSYYGKLEPHSISLSKYAGQLVYIAFLHDSQDDNLIILDDILVSRVAPISAVAAPTGIARFDLLQNPTQDFAYLTWQLKSPQSCMLRLLDANGREMARHVPYQQVEGVWYLDLSAYKPGVYYCTLQTERGVASKRLVKL